MHTRCVRCGHPLRNAANMRLGYSAACWQLTGRTLAAVGTSIEQNAKIGIALDLHMWEHVGADLYKIQSASGTGKYLTSAVSCTCETGRQGNRRRRDGSPICWHTGLVKVLEARP